jgi:hypothetical protein
MKNLSIFIVSALVSVAACKKAEDKIVAAGKAAETKAAPTPAVAATPTPAAPAAQAGADAGMWVKAAGTAIELEVTGTIAKNEAGITPKTVDIEVGTEYSITIATDAAANKELYTDIDKAKALAKSSRAEIKAFTIEEKSKDGFLIASEGLVVPHSEGSDDIVIYDVYGRFLVGKTKIDCSGIAHTPTARDKLVKACRSMREAK